MDGDLTDADYREIDMCLEQARKDLTGICMSNGKDGVADCFHSSNVGTVKQDQLNGSPEHMDFLSIFAQSGLTSDHQSVNQSKVDSKDSPSNIRRPDRPMTLSRPVNVPNCCNFKRQPWRLYVQGEFSYSSLPRHYRGMEKEINNTYKEDLTRIMEDLGETQNKYESKFKNARQNYNVPKYELMSESSALQSSDKGPPIVNGDKQCFFGYGNSAIDSQSQHDCQKFPVEQKLMSPVKLKTIKDENGYLEKDGKIFSSGNTFEQSKNARNCSTFGVSSNASRAEEPDMRHLESRKAKQYRSDEAQTECSWVQEPMFARTKQKSFPVLQMPPPPPEVQDRQSTQAPKRSESPTKRLKSRKSRNRSLQRSSEERLQASERRSRTLSPSITERLDYKVSRGTQTYSESDNPSLFLRGAIEVMTSKNLKNKNISLESDDHDRHFLANVNNSREFPNSTVDRISSSTMFGGFNNSNNKTLQGNGYVIPLKSAGALNNTGSRDSQKTKLLTIEEIDQSEASANMHGDVNRNTISEFQGSSSEPIEDGEGTGSTNLLDQMHKKLYPGQYQKKNRTRSAEILPQHSGMSNSEITDTKSATLPHMKPENDRSKANDRDLSDCPELRKHATLSPSNCESGKVSFGKPVLKMTQSVPCDRKVLKHVGSPSCLGVSSLSRRARHGCPTSVLPFSTPPPSQKFYESGDCEKKDWNENVSAPEQKLLETCHWLTSTGFPQYVQMYRDGQFSVDMATVESDHDFLEPDSFRVLRQWLTLLDNFASKKIRLSNENYSQICNGPDFLFALSNRWGYDEVTNCWTKVHQDQLPVQNLEKLFKNIPSNGDCCKSDCKSPPSTENGYCADEASTHLTSGYESEISPISTSSLTNCGTPRVACNSLTSISSHCHDRSPCHDRQPGYDRQPSEDVFLSNTIPFCKQASPKQGSVNSSDKCSTWYRTDSPNCDQNFKTTKSDASRHPVSSKQRLSIYDNMSMTDGDAQKELDLILIELYREIGFLSESLSQHENGLDHSSNSVNKLSNNEINKTSSYTSNDSTLMSESYQRQLSEKVALDNQQDSEKETNCSTKDISTEVEAVDFDSLFAHEFLLLKKLCTLKLTTALEKYSPTHLSCLSPVTRSASLELGANGKVFGVSLTAQLKQNGRPLPKAINQLMEHLVSVAPETVGIFRKPGVQSRIQQIQNQIDEKPDRFSFDGVDSYDIADALKRYFRDLPESLLTDQLAPVFAAVFTHVPANLQLHSIQMAVLILPEANRCVLQTLLTFLSEIAKHSDQNQMTSSNLAVCFLPSFFRMQPVAPSNKSNSVSQKSEATTVPQWDHKSAITCITFLINSVEELFEVSPECWETLQRALGSRNNSTPMRITDLESFDSTAFMQSSLDLLKEERGWTCCSSARSKVELSSKCLIIGHPMQVWKCVAEVEAPPIEVLTRVRLDHHPWGGNIIRSRVVERLDSCQADVLQYVLDLGSYGLQREFCQVRCWRSDLHKGSCVLASTSVDHPGASPGDDLRAVVTVSCYLIEPCGEGLTRLTHVSAVDVRGHTSEWYDSAFGLLLARYIGNIKDSFKQKITKTQGPETKV